MARVTQARIQVAGFEPATVYGHSLIEGVVSTSPSPARPEQPDAAWSKLELILARFGHPPFSHSIQD